MAKLGGMIVSTAELHQHLSDPTWVVFDCRHDLSDPTRGAGLYAAGHVAGAGFAPVDTVLSGRLDGTNGRHPLPEPAALAAFLADSGATADSTLVAYDDVGGQYAARLWWLARWIGHHRVAVLDGGWPKWQAEGRPISTEPAARPRGAITARPDNSGWVTTVEVMAVVESGGALILDARAPERYRGEVEPLDPVAGHIPTALNRFFKTNLHDDLTMRPAAELRAEFATLLGDRDPTQVLHQCGSGITACVNLLAMEHAGLGGSRLYAGSWSEWVADRSRPVVSLAAG